MTKLCASAAGLLALANPTNREKPKPTRTWLRRDAHERYRLKLVGYDGKVVRRYELGLIFDRPRGDLTNLIRVLEKHSLIRPVPNKLGEWVVRASG